MSAKIELIKILNIEFLSLSIFNYESSIEKQEGIADDLDEDIMIFGHTHHPYVKKIRDKVFINVGSVGRPKDGDNRACYCIVELGENLHVKFIRISYNMEKVAKEIEKPELLDVFAQIIRTGIDVII